MVTKIDHVKQIESFFSKMTREMLRGIHVNTKQELEEREFTSFTLTKGIRKNPWFITEVLK